MTDKALALFVEKFGEEPRASLYGLSSWNWLDKREGFLACHAILQTKIVVLVNMLEKANVKIDEQAARIAELKDGLRLYRDSHNVCLAGTPQGVCNKCRIADKLLPADKEPHPPHRQCGCPDCAPSFEPYDKDD